MIGVGSLSEEDIGCALQRRFVGGLAFRHGNLGESQMYCACYSYFCFIAVRNLLCQFTIHPMLLQQRLLLMNTNEGQYVPEKLFDNMAAISTSECKIILSGGELPINETDSHQQQLNPFSCLVVGGGGRTGDVGAFNLRIVAFREVSNQLLQPEIVCGLIVICSESIPKKSNFNRPLRDI
ncbi:hypothetical protein CEXT_512181 [Caerostris extrusa]|uniref:Ribosomal protein S2 n=1 Tax=Caerostris extrusa TaxID=172846 RepID=A0AAV4M6P9_CAEEX|nr:hypothetical protein CEXT_512181 [Caerostris extrusa]